MLRKESSLHTIKNSLNNEIQIRQKKLINIKKKGFNYPNNFKTNCNSQDILTKYTKLTNEVLIKLKTEIKIAGRMITRRIMGKASFATLQDMYGTIQLYITIKKCTQNFYKNEFKKWDLGDIIGVIGTLFKTKTGELSIYCTKIQLLTKSLRPLPDKYHGLLNQETRYRRRYLDLISNTKLFQIFKTRSNIITIIRNFLIQKKFFEVETPMMHNIPGGANAKPFETYHNALNTKLYLRIAPELYLKQLIIGGFERIFEINRCFRNEGTSLYHNPEFTMMEIYMAYSNYKDMMFIIEDLFKNISQIINKSHCIKYANNIFNIHKKFHRLTMKESIIKYNSYLSLNDLNNLEKIKNICHFLKIEVEKEWNIGQIQTKIFEKTTEKKIIQPTFITKYPVEVSPLAKSNNEYPHLTDRFELFINGLEIANGFSELNDSEEQKKRFLKQQTQQKTNMQQNLSYDQEYITALEYGLPPTAGLGIGIDRLVMLFTNSKSIRDVILFPTLKPNLQKK
ncbi:lysyl-tRNA synthetase [Buchnera aphidicola (Nipponaphis monzeni)]|uniref:Lysine--tRNA ligase n=1 Tax=Buchnera aphidicola (Nipponaphis monzeni) TaxID=2495405 RepID=A0A455TAG8_9GAMM|nr:lysine--tRNA ligase [Buchnera aphidicola]BBI01334.1 lysyl-tRNA synthetase [Buchnera aphidicola (Nipponaphis monzeni)]